jgi:hypothetical protein
MAVKVQGETQTVFAQVAQNANFGYSIELTKQTAHTSSIYEPGRTEGFALISTIPTVLAVSATCILTGHHSGTFGILFMTKKKK